MASDLIRDFPLIKFSATDRKTVGKFTNLSLFPMKFLWIPHELKELNLYNTWSTLNYQSKIPER